jgi:hypothetical protein
VWSNDLELFGEAAVKVVSLRRLVILATMTPLLMVVIELVMTRSGWIRQ